MRTLTLCISFCIFSINFITSQVTNFSRAYSEQGYQDARSIVATGDDGTFVFTGLNKSSLDTLGDMYLTKINAAGAILWERFYGLPKEDGGNFLMKTQDDGFIISGHTAYNYGSSCNGYIIKTNSEGDELWRQFVGTAYDDVCNGAVQTKNGDLYFTGRVEDPESRKFDIMLCKITKDGSYKFMKTFGRNRNDIGYKIIEASDGNLLIAGFSENEQNHKENFALLKCDLEGNLIWAFYSTESNVHTRAYGVLPMENGNFIVVGGIAEHKNKASIKSAFISEIDANGSFKTFNPILEEIGKNYAYDLCKNDNGGFAITGSIAPVNITNDQSFVVLLDNKLRVKEHLIVPADKYNCSSTSIIKIDKNDFMLAGKEVKESDSNILISRVNFSLSTSTNEAFKAPYSLFPNPMSNYTYLKIENVAHYKNLLLYNSSGKLITNYEFEGDELFLYKEDLLSGIYFFKVADQNGKSITSGSLVIQ